jgi:hypothetical protein
MANRPATFKLAIVGAQQGGVTDQIGKFDEAAE